MVSPTRGWGTPYFGPKTRPKTRLISEKGVRTPQKPVFGGTPPSRGKPQRGGYLPPDQNALKMHSKWSKNGSKMAKKCDQNSEKIDILGVKNVQKCDQNSEKSGQKCVKNGEKIDILGGPTPQIWCPPLGGGGHHILAKNATENPSNLGIPPKKSIFGVFGVPPQMVKKSSKCRKNVEKMVKKSIKNDHLDPQNVHLRDTKMCT